MGKAGCFKKSHYKTKLFSRNIKKKEIALILVVVVFTEAAYPSFCNTHLLYTLAH